MVCRSVPWMINGGMERHVWELSKALKRLGHEVNLFSMAESVKKEGINVHQVRQVKIGHDFLDRHLWSLYVPRALDDYDLDVLHFQGLAAYGYARKKEGYVTTFHGISSLHGSHGGILSFFARKLKDHEERLIAKNAGHIIAVDENTKENIIKRYAPDSPITVIPNGVSVPEYLAEITPERGNSYTFLFVGRLSINKGLKTLLAAFSRFTDEDVRLVIVGDGQLRKFVEQAVKRDPRIVWRRAISDRQLWKEYKSADAVVLPSEYEGFGIVALEAMVVEKVFIGTPVGVLKEVAGKCGRVVKKGDVSDLYSAMRAAYENEIKCSKTAARRFVKEYSWDTIAKKTVNVYRSLA